MASAWITLPEPPPAASAPPAGAQRRPNPRPLLVVLVLVALSGGSCTLQTMMGSGQNAPSVEEFKQLVNELHPKSALDPAQTEKLAATLKDVADRTEQVGRAYRPYVLVFGTLLVAAYCFAAGLALKAFTFAPGAARALSSAATLVLPARVAFAAVEFAVARAVQPAIEAVAREALSAGATLPSSVSPEDAERAFALYSHTFASGASAMPIIQAVFVCLLFWYGRRYFQRVEVRALYEPKPPERAQ